MDNKSYVKKLLEMSKGYQIDTYREVNIKETHSPFEGTPKKHPSDENILILMTNPLSKNNKFFEFPVDSIGNIENLGTVTSEDGETIYKIRVWIKKGMPAIKSEPFIVK